MSVVHFRRRLFRDKESQRRHSDYTGVHIDFYDRLQDGLDRSFIQNRTPHRLGTVRMGKIGHSRPRKNQKQRDHEGYEEDATTMFHTHTHMP